MADQVEQDQLLFLGADTNFIFTTGFSLPWRDQSLRYKVSLWWFQSYFTDFLAEWYSRASTATVIGTGL